MWPRFCFFALLLLASGAAYAAPSLEKYKTVSIPFMTSYIVQTGLIPLNDEKSVIDYLKITDCKTAEGIKDDPFKKQEIIQLFTDKIKSLKPSDINPIYVRIPSTLLINGYNFETQSLNLLPTSQIKKVNSIPVEENFTASCPDTLMGDIKKLPTVYSVRLNYPVSLYRIPLKKNIAENVLPKLDKHKDRAGTSIIYPILYIQLEPIKPEISERGTLRIATMRGQVNIIDLYADPDHKVLLKRLNYGDNY